MRAAGEGGPAGAGAADAVVLAHGLWTGRWVMAPLGLALRRAGFAVRLFGYASMRASVANNAEALARFARGVDSERVHFVGHSLGGLIVLQMLKASPPRRPGRFVLLGSPVRGSAAARSLASRALGRALAAADLGDWSESGVGGGWATERDIGVIAGTLGLGAGRIIAPALATPNDGAVSLDEARLPQARDTLVLPVSHSGMLASREVAVQVAHFLRSGSFRRLGGP